MTRVRPFAAAVAQAAQPPPWENASNEPVRLAFVQDETPDLSVVGEQAPVEPPSPEAIIAHEVERRVTAIAEAAAEEGRAVGEAAGRQLYEQATEQVTHVVRDLAEATKTITIETEHALRRLAISIASVIVDREIAEDEDYVVGVVKDALEMLSESQSVEVRVGKADTDTLTAQLEQLTDDAPHVGRIRIKTDPTIGRGCTVQTQIATIDATVEGRLRQVLETMEKGGEQ